MVIQEGQPGSSTRSGPEFQCEATCKTGTDLGPSFWYLKASLDQVHFAFITAFHCVSISFIHFMRHSLEIIPYTHPFQTQLKFCQMRTPMRSSQYRKLSYPSTKLPLPLPSLPSSVSVQSVGCFLLLCFHLAWLQTWNHTVCSFAQPVSFTFYLASCFCDSSILLHASVAHSFLFFIAK